MVFTLEPVGVEGEIPEGEYFLSWKRTDDYGKLESGEVPFEDMRDALYEIAVNDKSGKLYEEAMEKLRQDAGVIYFFDRLN